MLKVTLRPVSKKVGFFRQIKELDFQMFIRVTEMHSKSKLDLFSKHFKCLALVWNNFFQMRITRIWYKEIMWINEIAIYYI
jgi:hypothetical protein